MTSGLHSDAYFEKFRVLESPDLTFRMLQLVVEPLQQMQIDVIAGPTTGGVLVAFALAHMLEKKAAYAEKPLDGRPGRVFRRGFDLAGKRVVVADDVATTGGSINDTLKAVEEQGGVPVAVALLVDRTSGFDPGVPVFSALKLKLQVWKPEQCPLCKQGLELTVRGKGRS